MDRLTLKASLSVAAKVSLGAGCSVGSGLQAVFKVYEYGYDAWRSGYAQLLIVFTFNVKIALLYMALHEIVMMFNNERQLPAPYRF